MRAVDDGLHVENLGMNPSFIHRANGGTPPIRLSKGDRAVLENGDAIQLNTLFTTEAFFTVVAPSSDDAAAKDKPTIDDSYVSALPEAAPAEAPPAEEVLAEAPLAEAPPREAPLVHDGKESGGDGGDNRGGDDSDDGFCQNAGIQAKYAALRAREDGAEQLPGALLPEALLPETSHVLVSESEWLTEPFIAKIISPNVLAITASDTSYDQSEERRLAGKQVRCRDCRVIFGNAGGKGRHICAGGPLLAALLAGMEVNARRRMIAHRAPLATAAKHKVQRAELPRAELLGMYPDAFITALPDACELNEVIEAMRKALVESASFSAKALHDIIIPGKRSGGHVLPSAPALIALVCNATTLLQLAPHMMFESELRGDARTAHDARVGAARRWGSHGDGRHRRSL